MRRVNQEGFLTPRTPFGMTVCAFSAPARSVGSGRERWHKSQRYGPPALRGLGWREDVVLGRRHGGVAHAVLPEGFVEGDVVGGVRMAEVEILPFFPILGVHFVDQAVIAIAEIGSKSGLRAGAAKERSHHGGAGVVCVHGRRAEEGFEGTHHVDGGVEGVVDEGLGLRKWGIFADDERDAAMGIDVVGTILRVVFEDEDSGVVPIRATGDGVDDAADGEVVIGDRSGGTRTALGSRRRCDRWASAGE